MIRDIARNIGLILSRRKHEACLMCSEVDVSWVEDDIVVSVSDALPK